MVEVIDGQRTFTLEEYHRMGEAGVFAPDERVELIRGVIRQMSPKGRRHVQAVTLLNSLLTPALKGRAVVQVQDPVPLRRVASEPEPDVCVLASSDPRDAGDESIEKPQVIEVADTSVRFDRENKARLYADAGVADYWIVNERHRVSTLLESTALIQNGTHFSSCSTTSKLVEPSSGPASVSQIGTDVSAIGTDGSASSPLD